MTRVLMTADTVGGVWTYALELAEALAAYDVEVHLATMGPAPTPAQRAEVEQSAVASFVQSEFALEWMPDPWQEVDRAGSWLLELEQELRPDLVHLNGFSHAALPCQAPTVVVGHSDVLSWWQAVHDEPAPPAWDTYRNRVAAGLAAAGAVVAPTRAALDALGRWYGCPGGTVVPNCRRADWLTPAPSTGKEPLVLGSGRVWDEAKGLSLLAGVAERAPWPVAIAGQGEGVGAAQHIGALPFTELSEWLLRAAVFAAPARYEPFGLGILEAAMAGCALVLGDIPSLREVWGDAAVYVPPTDPDALLSALRRLTDDGQRAAYAERAQQQAGQYSPDRTARGYLAVYEQLGAAA